MKQLPIRRFFVVIHTLKDGLTHVLDQARLAKDNDADGVIIIPDYAKGRDKMATIYDQATGVLHLKNYYPDVLVGVNFLRSVKGVQVLIKDSGVNFIQTDSSSADGLDRHSFPGVELFCGVAFKYSHNVDLQGESLKQHTLAVAAVCDVPTTSGNATGQSASLEKIKEIRKYLPEGKRLGLASGVTEENVTDYLSCGVTDFLVATSLVKHVDENGFDILDPEKIKRTARLIHSFN